MTAVREMLHANPRPLEPAMGTARARLDREMTARHPAPRRIARPLRWSLAGTGVLAVAVAAVLGLGAVRPAPPAGEPASARDILLAAAESAARAPAETGTYWHVKRLVTTQFRVPAGYQVTNRQVYEAWYGAQSWSGHRNLGTKPSTPADEEAWRRDGSPTEWGPTILSGGGTEPTLHKTLTTYLGESEVTPDELRTLPADPARLKEWLTRRIWAQGGIGTEQNASSQLFWTLGELLAETPAEPGVRAAAFRLLADTPGVRAAGPVEDERGRAGTAIAYESEGVRGEIVIDEASMRILSHGRSYPETSPNTPKRAPITTQKTLVLTAEWSNEEPAPPTGP